MTATLESPASAETPERIEPRDVTFKIRRFIPELDEEPHWEEYVVSAYPTDRVLPSADPWAADTGCRSGGSRPGPVHGDPRSDHGRGYAPASGCGSRQRAPGFRCHGAAATNPDARPSPKRRTAPNPAESRADAGARHCGEGWRRWPMVQLPSVSRCSSNVNRSEMRARASCNSSSPASFARAGSTGTSVTCTFITGFPKPGWIRSRRSRT